MLHDHDDHLSNQVLWYKDTMKLIEGDRIHMANVGNTYKLSIAGDDDDDDDGDGDDDDNDDDVDDDDDDPIFIHHDENHDGDCDTCIYMWRNNKVKMMIGYVDYCGYVIAHIYTSCVITMWRCLFLLAHVYITYCIFYMRIRVHYTL